MGKAMDAEPLLKENHLIETLRFVHCAHQLLSVPRGMTGGQEPQQ